jgi:hypothetical protein
MRRLLLPIAAGLVVSACGNFFPNPENVALPSGVRSYALECGPVPHDQCILKAEALVTRSRTEHRGLRVTRIQLQGDGSYTITFDDGTAESVIVN